MCFFHNQHYYFRLPAIIQGLFKNTHSIINIKEKDPTSDNPIEYTQSYQSKEYVYIFFGFVFLAIFIYFDSFEYLNEFFSRYERFELDELFLVSIYLIIGLLVYASQKNKHAAMLVSDLKKAENRMVNLIESLENK